MPSVSSVSPVSGKIGLASASHTLYNSCDLMLSISCDAAARGEGFLDAIIMLWSLCQKGHRHVQIVDMSDEHTGQSMRTTLF